MAANHKFHPNFPDDLGEALDYFDEYSVETGNRLRQAIKGRIQLIIENPLIFSVAYDDVRVARLPKYPYSIHYRVVEGTTKFLSLIHTSKDRKNWPGRK